MGTKTHLTRELDQHLSEGRRAQREKITSVSGACYCVTTADCRGENRKLLSATPTAPGGLGSPIRKQCLTPSSPQICKATCGWCVNKQLGEQGIRKWSEFWLKFQKSSKTLSTSRHSLACPEKHLYLTDIYFLLQKKHSWCGPGCCRGLVR